MQHCGRLLGDLMVEMGLIDREDLKRALELQARTGALLGDVLIDMGMLGEEALRWALARQLDIPLIHPDPKALDPDALSLISPEKCRRYAVLPISLLPEEEDPAPVLTIAAADPADGEVLEDVRRSVPYRVKVVASLREEIFRCLDRVYGTARDVSDSSVLMADGVSVKSDPTGLKLLGRLIGKMLSSRQKTIRIFSSEGKTVARDGEGAEHFRGPSEWLAILLERARKLSSMQESRQGVGSRGKLWYRADDGSEVLLRIVILRTMGGEEMHLRAIMPEKGDKSLENLGFSQRQVESVRGALSSPGLSIVSVPGGEGLISTLYALLREAGPGGRRIVLEEEVVYRAGDAVQLEISASDDLHDILRDLKYMEFDRILMGRASREMISDLLALSRRGKWVFAGVEEASMADTLEVLAKEADRGTLMGLNLVIHQRMFSVEGEGNVMGMSFEVLPVDDEVRKAVRTSGADGSRAAGRVIGPEKR